VGHHQKSGSGRSPLNGVSGHLGAFDRDVRRHLARKLIGTTVNPRDPAWQLTEHARQRLAYMTGAEQNDVECLGADRLEQKPAPVVSLL
jgi:hypothetical protein